MEKREEKAGEGTHPPQPRSAALVAAVSDAAAVDVLPCRARANDRLEFAGSELQAELERPDA